MARGPTPPETMAPAFPRTPYTPPVTPPHPPTYLGTATSPDTQGRPALPRVGPQGRQVPTHQHWLPSQQAPHTPLPNPNGCRPPPWRPWITDRTTPTPTQPPPGLLPHLHGRPSLRAPSTWSRPSLIRLSIRHPPHPPTGPRTPRRISPRSPLIQTHWTLLHPRQMTGASQRK